MKIKLLLTLAVCGVLILCSCNKNNTTTQTPPVVPEVKETEQSENEPKTPEDESTNTDNESENIENEMNVPEIENGDKIYILKIDNYYVSHDEFRYYYMSYKNEMDGGDEAFWENNDQGRSELTVTIVDSLKMALAIKNIAASENLELTEEEKQTVSKACDSFEAEYKTKEEYEKFLSDNYLTDKLFREQEEMFTLADKVKIHYCEQLEPPLTEDEYLNMLYEKMDAMKTVFVDEDGKFSE